MKMETPKILIPATGPQLYLYEFESEAFMEVPDPDRPTRSDYNLLGPVIGYRYDSAHMVPVTPGYMEGEWSSDRDQFLSHNGTALFQTNDWVIPMEVTGDYNEHTQIHDYVRHLRLRTQELRKRSA